MGTGLAQKVPNDGNGKDAPQTIRKVMRYTQFLKPFFLFKFD